MRLSYYLAFGLTIILYLAYHKAYGYPAPALQGEMVTQADPSLQGVAVVNGDAVRSRRARLLTEWFQAVEMIRLKTHDQHVARNINFGREHFYLVEPSFASNGDRIDVQEWQARWPSQTVPVYVILPEDGNSRREWKKAQADSQANPILLAEEGSLLILGSPDAFTPIWRGIAFLNALEETRLEEEMPPPKIGDSCRLDKELAKVELILRLLPELEGSKYRAFLVQEEKQYLVAFGKGNTASLEDGSEVERKLNHFFGPAKIPAETKLRELIFILQMRFYAVEVLLRGHAEEVKKLKLLILQSLLFGKRSC